jgi:myo-inositol-1(or 4)-monophosphatase
MNQYSRYYNILGPWLREIGEELRQKFGNIEAIEQKTNSPTDGVTELDRKVETFLAERLMSHDKTTGFFGEEYGQQGNTERFWLADPIDGTAHFIRGIPFCTTMLALIEQGEAVFSIIYNFTQDAIYWAAKGEGAYRNEKRIHVSNRSLQESYLCYEMNLEDPQALAWWLAIRRRYAVFVKTVNTGFEYSLIAEGKLDGRICLKPSGKDWDYAPGALLVAEAGGTVRNIGKDTFDYQDHNFIAANEKIYREVSDILTQNKS